jgi:hypothetical protein
LLNSKSYSLKIKHFFGSYLLKKNGIHCRQILAAIWGEISALRGKKTYYFEGGMGLNFAEYFGEKKTLYT